MIRTWANQAVFYHLFPLGCLGCPARNPFTGAATDRLQHLHEWLDYLQDLGVTAVLLGPVFESSAHGYDVADYFHVDRRLGCDETLAAFSRDLHRRGMRLVLDAVFHHTGRDFWAFQEVRRDGQASPYRDWYHLDFSRHSPFGDPFHYEGWDGHFDLAKLNLGNAAVREHLFAAVSSWVERFGIDGLRLDAADRLAPDFRGGLADHCATLKDDFWLLGEVVHGDYRQWVHPGGLHATTNYELYKSLWSSHNDKNYFELAFSLDRQFGARGMYRDLGLYSFSDNHDVDRVASTLVEPCYLYPLYLLLFTVPGIPSLYYGSEWGVTGRRTSTSDAALRPVLCLRDMRDQAQHPDLFPVIKRLLAIRSREAALREGEYTSIHVDHEQLVFMRGKGSGAIVIAVNASGYDPRVTIRLPGIETGLLSDQLNEGDAFPITAGRCTLPLHPHWGRILAVSA